MKRLPFLILAVALVCMAVYAGSTVLVGTLTSVNGTSDSTSVTLGNVYPQRGLFYIQNGGLASTNALTLNVQVSVDGSNWMTVATYYPTTTNATTDTYAPSYTALPMYMRAQVVTTNAVNVGVIYTQ